MAASRFKTDSEGRMWVADLVALTDAELDQYLADNNNLVRIADTGDLPESLFERLRERSRRPCSKPVDLDQVTARLLQAAATGDASPKFRSPPPDSPYSHLSTLPPSPPGRYWRLIHGELANDGGRPLFPAEMIDQVFGDPSSYGDMLLPWMEFPDAPPDTELAVGNQLEHWRHFRTWQKYNRDLTCSPDPSWATSKYFYARFIRRSPDYTDALRTLLMHYDFNRPFQLHADPARQDALTTWIEYFGWTCAAHYRFARLIEQHQPAYDEAWKALVDTGLLRPYETTEYLETMESGFAADAEDNQAHQDVLLAQSAVDAASSMPDGDSWDSQEAQALELSAANSTLEAALARQDVVTRRIRHVSNFINATRLHRHARSDAKWQNTIMHWVLEQLPLVEAEGNTATPSGPKPDAEGEAPGCQSCREPQHHQDQTPSPPPDAREPSPTRSGTASRPVHPDDAAEDGRRSKRLRKNSDGRAIETGTAGAADHPVAVGATRSRRQTASPQPASSASLSRRATRSPAVPDSPGTARFEGALAESGGLQTGTGPIIDESAQRLTAMASEASHRDAPVNISTSMQEGAGKRKRAPE
ncbi:hypothetical protein C8A05DRAFT_18468 [Staphylotrichum tortipilum]|uniref:Uncharacterized protein n=1 Tax=Staphylotrichum tortipilum TaxID=2831512 RepID=A0AAN6MDW5_9PEZI|nr:hypothetical protein C8A05DRAFT_18468 [Staphylotrichum longicolle]